jgi:hypothetical protein
LQVPCFAASQVQAMSRRGRGAFALGPIGRPGGGVRPGAYRLSISTAFSLDSDAPAPKELVPAAHVNGVDYEVSAGGDSAVTLDLKSTGKPR